MKKFIVRLNCSAAVAQAEAFSMTKNKVIDHATVHYRGFLNHRKVDNTTVWINANSARFKHNNKIIRVYLSSKTLKIVQAGRNVL